MRQFVEAPLLLSHYTDLPGLKSIIETGRLWASNVSFLNDRRELRHGLEATIEALKSLESADGAWKRCFQRAVDDLDLGAIPNTYAICFCEKPDVLSQWRSYGGTEQNVSIVFDRSRLQTMLASSEALLYPVVYGKLKAPGQVTEHLLMHLNELLADEMAGRNYSAAERMNRAHNIVCNLLPQFKHLGFQEEREWRFVIQQPDLSDDVKFRASGNRLIPYLEVGPSRKRKLPIRAVRVGPGRDQALTKESIELFLRSRGYQAVRVQLSDVPYRR
jgi:hypothetical protein